MVMSTLLLIYYTCLFQYFVSSLANVSTARSFPLTSVDYAKIIAMDRSTGLEIIHQMITLGGFQISGIPNFHDARHTALSNLASCLLKDDKSVETKVYDGRTRLSVGAATINFVTDNEKRRETGEKEEQNLSPMSNDCGAPSQLLRQIVVSVSNQLFTLLDQQMAMHKDHQPLMVPYHSFQELIQHGNHLEHLHSYYEYSNTTTSTPTTTTHPTQGDLFTLPLHTDSGLFIAMTAALSTSEELSNSHSTSLYIQLPSQQIVAISPNPDSLIIMIGQGGASWLAPIFGAPLRALPHAVRIETTEITRSWYGKMFLPPSDALLPLHNDKFIRYEDYRLQEIQVSQDASKLNSKATSRVDNFPVACGRNSLSTSSLNQFLEMTQNSLCNDGNGVMCWQNCYPLSDFSCGAEAECVDSATGESTDGDKMCHTCHVECPTATESGFCWGKGVDMYMDGFTSFLTDDRGSYACLILFFQDWILDKKYKIIVACIGIIFLGIVIEVLSAVRRRVFSDLPSSHSRNLFLLLLHSSQTSLGYFLMLSAMTYNVELFCMVLIGIGIGHFFFNINEPPQETTDPCCPQTSETELTEHPETKEYGTYQQLTSL